MTMIHSRHTDQHSLPTPDRLDQQGLSRSQRTLRIGAMALLFLSALPDAMVVPVLHQLMVERYEVSTAAAHAFMCVNLLGALTIVGFINRVLRRGRTERTIAIAAGLNALLLALMALPIGFFATLAVRYLEGMVDMIVYALLFSLIANAGTSRTKGRRMGAAATALMLGIAIGIGLGGFAGTINPTLSLWFGAVACVIVIPLALVFLRGSSDTTINAESASPSEKTSPRGPLWPALIMMFSDRAVAGVLVSTVPLYFATMARFDSATTGGLIGISMLMTALGAWPAGRLADRIGYMRVRLFAGLMYAIGFASMATFSLISPVATTIIMIAFGLAGAALFASSLLVVCQSGRGPAGMAAYHTAGNLGFLVGPLVAGVTLKLFEGGGPGIGVYVAILGGFALMHALGTAFTFVGVVLYERRQAITPTDPQALSSPVTS